MRINIETLWARLADHEGDAFTQIRGGTFSYSLSHTALRPDRTDWAIPRTHFEEALALVPLKSTVAVQHLYGPSYIYAVLMDPRVRTSGW